MQSNEWTGSLMSINFFPEAGRERERERESVMDRGGGLSSRYVPAQSVYRVGCRGFYIFPDSVQRMKSVTRPIIRVYNSGVAI